MRWKTTLALLLAAIGIGAYISLYEIRQPTPEERERLSKEILNLSPEAITQVAIQRPTAGVTLIRDGATWRLLATRARADESAVNRILADVNPLIAERILQRTPQQPLDDRAFGLNPPVGQVTFLRSTGSPLTLLIGESTAVKENRYVKVAGRQELFVVSSSVFADVDRPAEAFRDAHLIRLEAWMTDGLSLASPITSWTVARNGQDWRLQQPITDRAERAEVNAFLTSLSGIMIKRFVDDAPQVEHLAEWGFDQPKAELILTQRAGESAARSTTLLFGKPLAGDPALLYAKRSDEPFLYAVSASDIEPLLKNPTRLRATSCFEFFVSQVEKLSVARDSARWTITRAEALPNAPSQENTRWRVEGADTPLDLQQVETFLSEIADLRVNGFVEGALPPDRSRYGLEPPAGEISLWTAHREPPQRMLVGSAIDQSTDRYGLIEGRDVIVKLPAVIMEWLAATPDYLRQASPTHAPYPAPKP